MEDTINKPKIFLICPKQCNPECSHSDVHIENTQCNIIIKDQCAICREATPEELLEL